VANSLSAILNNRTRRRRTAAADRVSAQVESLEARRLLSVTATQLIGSQAVPTGGTLPTTTTLVDTAPIISLGGSEVFTSTIAPVTPGGPVPTGTVTFFSYNGTYPTQIEPVQSNGTAAMPLSGTIPGYMAFIAFYSGDTNYAASNSAAVFSAVNGAPVVPTIAHDTLPSSILTNANVKGVVNVTLSNPTASTISGVQGLNVFALQYQGGQSFASHRIGTIVEKKVVLAPGASRTFPVKVNVKSADGTAGIYSLVATATNSAIQSSFSEAAAGGASTNFTVAAANVALSAKTTALLPSTLGAKAASFSFTVTVENTGNEDANGGLTIAADAYNDTYPVGALPSAIYHFSAHIKVGKSQRFVVHGRYGGEGSLIAGTFNLNIAATLDGATAQTTTPATYTVS